ncbi:MAG: hypothetical protein V1706_12355 [Pseudomonadota bacterium]
MAIRNIYSVISFLTAIGMTIFTSGCTTLGSNLTQNDAVKIKIFEASNTIVVSSVNVYEQNEKLVVFGSMNRTFGYRGKIRGHVDIDVIGPDGTTLTTQTTAHPFPGNSHANARYSRFFAYLDSVPPAGSVIQVAAHKGIHQ